MSENRNFDKINKISKITMLDTFRVIEKQQKKLREAAIIQSKLNIAQIITLPRHDFFKRVKLIFSSIRTLNKDITRSFIYYNLPIHYAIPLDTMHDINEAFSIETERSKVEDIYTNDFESYTLDIIRNNWNESELLEDRKLIFTNLITAYDKGLYSVVVPAITVQMESIVKKKINKRKISTGELRRVSQSIFSSDSFIDEITKFYYIDIFLKGNIQDPNNRHSVIHGSVVNYTEKIHAIKAIVLFDTLLTQLEQTDSEKLLR